MKRGFTLIELMIVIAVIAILVGISLPHFKGMRDEGNMAKAAGELRSLATAIESYRIHDSSKAYPDPGEAVQTEWESNLTGASPQIIASILYDPFVAGGSTEYSYCTSDTSGLAYYVVFSVGPDGTAGITGIDPNGDLEGTVGDAIYFTNAEAGTGGF